MTPAKQTVFLSVKIEDELPNEFDIVTFIAKVPVDNLFPNLTSDEEIDFSFRGWRENDKFLMHGIGEELADGKVTHWLKSQEGYFFRPEQLNEYTDNVIKQSLENAAEKVELIETDGDPDPKSILNTFKETYKKFKV
jgi:hypothetical protein